MTNVIDDNFDHEDQPSGRAKGGKARAENMSNEDRKASSLKAVEAKRAKALLPTVINEGYLRVGEADLEVAVLDNGDRVVSAASVFTALGRTRRGNKKSLEEQRLIDGIQTPAFMDAINLIPYINQELKSVIPRMEFKTKSGVIKDGYNAVILPLVGDLYLRAREDGAIKTKEQQSVAQKAEILVRSLAKVGVIALVDEATGYQKERERDALAKLLEEFIAKEMRPWVSTYPPEFFEELCRLRGVPFKANMRRPQYFGHLVNNITYDRMAPDLRNALKEEKAKAKKSGAKMHQFLSDGTGYGLLQKRLTGVTTLMQVSDTYDGFIGLLDKVHPLLSLPDADE
nr:P63C domain-containing protein [uncultured Erwinia sp.]